MGQEGQQRLERVLLGQLGLRVGDQVRVCGWVQTLRLQRRMQFVVLCDESGAVQLTNRRETRPELDQRIDALTVGSAIALTGRVVDAPQVKLGGIEVLVDSIDQLSIAEQPLPIAENSNADRRLDWRFLDLRAPRQHLIFKVGDLFEQRMRSFLLGRGFTELHTSKLMGSASESGAEVFRVDYFESPAYLAQSPQFHKQLAIAAAHAIAGVRDALGRQVEEVFAIDLVVPATPLPRGMRATSAGGPATGRPGRSGSTATTCWSPRPPSRASRRSRSATTSTASASAALPTVASASASAGF
jgi:tRNA synthetases class II (D, K and N)/OB-fold nucleic acid binding domain